MKMRSFKHRQMRLSLLAQPTRPLWAWPKNFVALDAFRELRDSLALVGAALARGIEAAFAHLDKREG